MQESFLNQWSFSSATSFQSTQYLAHVVQDQVPNQLSDACP